MREWKWGEWSAYAALVLSTVMVAWDGALRNSQEIAKKVPDSMKLDGFLALAPLLLVLFATAILLLKHFGWLPDFTVKGNAKFIRWPNPYVPKLIASQELVNTEVLLDGNSYLRCTFRNCTFKYNGTTTVQLQYCNFVGEKLLKTDNPSVMGAWTLLYGLGLLKEIHFTHDVTSIVEPMKTVRVDPPKQ